MECRISTKKLTEHQHDLLTLSSHMTCQLIVNNMCHYACVTCMEEEQAQKTWTHRHTSAASFVPLPMSSAASSFCIVSSTAWDESPLPAASGSVVHWDAILRPISSGVSSRSSSLSASSYMPTCLSTLKHSPAPRNVM